MGSRLRSSIAVLASLVTGAGIGLTSQHLASADISSGDRPVLITIEPCRLSDTRPGDNQVGPRAVPLGPADVHTVDAQEADTPCTGNIPTDASALSLNVTALSATELSFLTIWAGGDRPLAASLNPAPGQPPVPNAVTTQLSVDQEFEIYNNAGTVDIVIDANGYYTNHNHDDRYSPLGHDHDDRYDPRPKPGDVDVVRLRPFDFYLDTDTTDFDAEGTLVIGKTDRTCHFASLDLPESSTIKELALRAGAEFVAVDRVGEVFLIAGEVPIGASVVDFEVIASSSAVGDPGKIFEVTADVDHPSAVIANTDREYSVVVCVSADTAFHRVDITFEH